MADTAEDVVRSGGHPFGKPTGRPLEFSAELIERVLFEVAIAGGNCSAAMRVMNAKRDEMVELAAEEGVDAEFEELPPVVTVRRWVRGRFRNRYHEIRQSKAAELEELLAQRQMDRAVQADQLIEDSMRKVGDRLDGANAVEASMILRNVAQAQKIQVDNASQLRQQGAHSDDSRSLRQIAESLARIGAITLTDTDVMEVADPPPEELEAGRPGGTS